MTDKIEHEIKLLLVQFGNYLLSEERQEAIVSRDDLESEEVIYKLNHVTNTDIFTFFHKLNENNK